LDNSEKSVGARIFFIFGITASKSAFQPLGAQDPCPFRPAKLPSFPSSIPAVILCFAQVSPAFITNGNPLSRIDRSIMPDEQPTADRRSGALPFWPRCRSPNEAFSLPWVAIAIGVPVRRSRREVDGGAALAEKRQPTRSAQSCENAGAKSESPAVGLIHRNAPGISIANIPTQ
jgi:hypothetical protein